MNLIKFIQPFIQFLWGEKKQRFSKKKNLKIFQFRKKTKAQKKMCERRLFLFCFVLLLVILDPVYTPESMIPNSQTRKKGDRDIDSLQNWFLTYISFNGSQKRFFSLSILLFTATTTTTKIKKIKMNKKCETTSKKLY